MTRPRRRQFGLTLVELSMALFCAAMLSAGAMHYASAASAGFRLQRDLSALQESARFALSLLGDEARQAGFAPLPLAASISPGALTGSTDGADGGPDTLALRRWSDRNCFDNENPVTDAAGRPRHYLRQTRFSIRNARELVLRCGYGPDADQLVTQVNNLGLAENVRTLQVLFAEDGDGDGLPDRWVRPGEWTDESAVLAARVALLTALPHTGPGAPAGQTVNVAGSAYPVEPGHLARVTETTVPLLGRRSR